MGKAECPRCGRVMGRLDLHSPSCDRFPLPDELRTVLENESLSQVGIARRYGVSAYYVKIFMEDFGMGHLMETYKRIKATPIKAEGDANCAACGVKVFSIPPPVWLTAGMCMVEEMCEWCYEKGHPPTKINKRAEPLSVAKVIAIREMRAHGHTYKELAKAFGVTQRYVSNVCKGKRRNDAGGHIETVETRNRSTV